MAFVKTFLCTQQPVELYYPVNQRYYSHNRNNSLPLFEYLSDFQKPDRNYLLFYSNNYLVLYKKLTVNL